MKIHIRKREKNLGKNLDILGICFLGGTQCYVLHFL